MKPLKLLALFFSTISSCSTTFSTSAELHLLSKAYLELSRLDTDNACNHKEKAKKYCRQVVEKDSGKDQEYYSARILASAYKNVLQCEPDNTAYKRSAIEFENSANKRFYDWLRLTKASRVLLQLEPENSAYKTNAEELGKNPNFPSFFHLAKYYRYQSEKAEENLTNAIKYYKKAGIACLICKDIAQKGSLECLKNDNFSYTYLTAKSFFCLSQLDTDKASSHKENAIKYYKEALSVLNKKRKLYDCWLRAKCYHRLSQLDTDNDSSHKENAIKYYKEALSVSTEKREVYDCSRKAKCYHALQQLEEDKAQEHLNNAITTYRLVAKELERYLRWKTPVDVLFYSSLAYTTAAGIALLKICKDEWQKASAAKKGNKKPISGEDEDEDEEEEVVNDQHVSQAS